MAIATDTYDAPIERQPGQFARHAKTGAPYVAHPTETTQHTGTKAELITLCAQRGIALPEKVTVKVLQGLLGPRPTRVQYGRPSSLGKQIENMTNIQKWSERAVALGCFLDALGTDAHPWLLDELRTLDPDQWNLDDADARELLDKIAVRAKATAQAGLAADRGTHTHELTEDHDTEVDWIERARRGDDLGIDYGAQAALVAAWAKMLAEFDIEILATEAQCVDDVWRQAGTLDRICRLRRELRFITVTGEFVTLPAGWVGILDIKTGKLRLDRSGFVSYWHGYSVQLASYAQSVPYDPDTDQRGEWPWPIDQQWAVIAHLDVLAALDGEAVCRLVLVDLEAGRHAGALCVASRDWEKRTDVFSIPTDELAVRVPVTTNATGGDVRDGAQLPSGTPDTGSPPVATEVSALAPAPEPPRAAPEAPLSAPVEAAPCAGADTTHEHCDRTDGHAVMLAFGIHNATCCTCGQPFIAPPEQPLPPAPVAESDWTHALDAGPIGPPAKPLSPLQQAQADRKRQITEAEAKRRLHTTPEEGDMSDDRTFLVLQKRFERLSPPRKQWITALGRAAHEAGVSFSAKETKTARRYETLRALVVLAERDESDEQVREWLTLVDERIAQLATVPLGHIVGSLSATEAATFARLVTDELTVVHHDDGTTTLAPAVAA